MSTLKVKHILTMVYSVICLCDPQILVSQTLLSDTICNLKLKKVFFEEDKNIEETFGTGKCWQLKYTTSTVVINKNNNGYETIKNKGELIAGKHNRIKKSDEGIIYADEKEIFYLTYKDRQILRTKSNATLLKKLDEKYLEATTDSLVKSMPIIDCKEVLLEKHNVVCYTLKSHSMRNPYLKVLFYVDSKTNSLYRIHIDMNLAYQKNIKSYTFTILEKNKIDNDNSWEHIHDIFLNANDKLNPTYSSYKLKDLTKGN